MTGVRLGIFVPLAAALLFVVGPAEGAPGGLDPSFGQGGSVTTGETFPGGAANALVGQPDGKLIAVGTQYDPVDTPAPGDIVLARYNADGSLDTSFGSDGVVKTTVPGGNAGANAAVLQPDGKIVVAGDYEPAGGGQEFALARYDSNGELDTSFGNGGIVTTQVEDVGSEAFGVALQPDGSIVVGGEATSSTNGTGSAVVRYQSNGSLDPNFGTGGIVFSTQPGENGFAALALQPDGKILGVGRTTPLTRFEADGTLDTSFGNGGISGMSAAEGNALAVQADGKIVVAGGMSNDFRLVRVDPDGSADQTFGSDGVVTTPMGSGSAEASAVAIQPDGKIVAAGTTRPSSAALVTVARYDQNGSLDVAFGSGGIASSTQPSGTSSAGASAVALQPDGKIVVAGWAEPNGWATGEFALARFLVTSMLTVSKSGSGSGSVISSPAGIDCGSVCSGEFAAAASVTLSATPAVGSVFAGWSGACSGTGTCTATLNADTSVTATFDPVMNTLRVAKRGKGHGMVTSLPAGIRCGLSCSHAYAYGTAVTLVARPKRGSAFRGWYGACSHAGKRCTLTMKQARSTSAVFRRKLECIVPKVKGKSLEAARRKIKQAHCRTGTIRHKDSRIKKGHVISQKPRARRHLRDRSRVDLVLSNGRRR